MRCFFSAAFLLATILPEMSAADWPCWRGPDALGVSAETNLPVAWSRQKNVAWTMELPGQGASSPIVLGERVYLTTQTPDNALHGPDRGQFLLSDNQSHASLPLRFK